MFAKPQKEHEWLNQFVGKWNLFHQCEMPNGSRSETNGKINCRSLEGMWLSCEMSGESDGQPWTSIMIVGFDIAKKQYVGTFAGSMMPNIWSYTGDLDDSQNQLSLYTEGPKMDGSVGTCPYRDIFGSVVDDVWRFGSEMQNEDGSWFQFMHGKHTRL